MIRDYLSKNCKENDSNATKFFYINLVIIAIMFIISIVFIGKLPAKIPIMHDGAQQIFIDSKLGVFLIPIIALVANILFKLRKRLYLIQTILFIFALIGMVYYYFTLI